MPQGLGVVLEEWKCLEEEYQQLLVSIGQKSFKMLKCGCL